MGMFDLSNEGFSAFLRKYVTGRDTESIRPVVSDGINLVGALPLPSVFGDTALSWTLSNSRDPGAGNTATFFLSTDAPGGMLIDSMYQVLPTNGVNRVQVGLTGTPGSTVESTCSAWGTTVFNGPETALAGITGDPVGTVTLESDNAPTIIQQQLCTRIDFPSIGAAVDSFLVPLGIYVPPGFRCVFVDLQTLNGNVMALGFHGRVFPVTVPDFVTGRS